MGIEYIEGPEDFLSALDEFGLRDDPDVEVVVEWAQALEDEGLAHQRTTLGEKLRALRVELPEEGVSLVTVYRNKHCVSIALEGLVFLRAAQRSADRIDERWLTPKRLNRHASSYPSRPYPPQLLDDLTAAYREAAN